MESNNLSMISIAHRGSSGLVPENTMLAFTTAIANHADVIELDVQLTKDLEVVIFHDRSLERITGEAKGIADFTLSELKEKDVGTWKNVDFEGLQIPTFTEVLQLLPKDQSLIVEIKPQNRDLEKPRVLENKVLSILDEHRGPGELGYLSVRDVETYEYLYDHNSKYNVGLMQKKRSPEEFLEIVIEHEVMISQIRWKTYVYEDIAKLKALNTLIIAFCGDTISDFEILTRWQVNGIITNYPGILNGYLLLKDL